MSVIPAPLRDATLVGPARFGKAGRRLIAAAALLLAWELISRVVGEESLAGPWGTLASLGQWVIRPEFWVSIGQTLTSTLLGLFIAAAIAIPIGLAIGMSRLAIASTRITLDFLGSIPPICFLPLGLLLFGPSLPMKLLLIGYGACWPLLIRTVDALRDIHPVQHDVSDAFALRGWVRWTHVYLPGALPGIMVGLRISLTIALLLSVGAEYVGGAAGIGAQLTAAQQAGRPEDAQVFAVVAAALGLGLALGMRGIERAVIGWHPSVRSAGKP
jgi:ABC-type nitrate/sulfonate/bicarbonate transport system permease component